MQQKIKFSFFSLGQQKIHSFQLFQPKFSKHAFFQLFQPAGHLANGVINPFVPNAPFLYPLKISENLTVF